MWFTKFTQHSLFIGLIAPVLPNVTDTINRGSIIARIISQVHKNALIIPIKITANNDISQDNCEYIIKGVNWAIKNNVDIINLSFGMEYSNKDYIVYIFFY